MPLTKDGKQILKNFKKEYGRRGESVFYKWLNSLSEEEKRKYERKRKK